MKAPQGILKAFLVGFSLLMILLLGTVLIGGGGVNRYVALIAIQGAINVVIALSLNLISGFTGQLALGHAGFMAIGAYTSAFMVMRLGMPLGLAILAGGLVTAVFGFAIGLPALRLRGDYLAIVTLGFGEIIRVILVNLEGITGGSAGLKGIPSFVDMKSLGLWIDAAAARVRDGGGGLDLLLAKLKPLEILAAASFFWTGLVMILCYIGVRHLIASSWGRAIMSIREDEVASRSMGLSSFRYKMFAFTLSTFLAGIGGALFAHYFRYLAPADFNFLKSVDFLIIVVLGGMGSATGTLISGYTLTILQEYLRFLKDYRLVIYAFILILIMLFRPGGLMGKRELSLSDLGAFFKSLTPRALKRRFGGEAGGGADHG